MNLPGDPPADPAKLLFISLCFGMSLAVNAWVFFRISGGLSKPRRDDGHDALGSIAASAVISGLAPGPLNVQTTLGGGTTVVQGLFIGMFLMAQLVFTIFMLAAEKHRATFIAPVGIGLSLFIAELMFAPPIPFSIHPQQFSLSDRSLLASGFYVFIKALEYETVNPDQDETGEASAEPKAISNGLETNGRSWDEGTTTVDRGSASYMGGPSLEASQPLNAFVCLMR
ncbi:hypothetical protein GGS26DRAFT_590029 [Hypomontagnella submonticulosa]|nr:hypothetical protein GGS26DRAFT_590029 [Hypomontagnella submonticulosa]